MHRELGLKVYVPAGDSGKAMQACISSKANEKSDQSRIAMKAVRLDFSSNTAVV